MRILTVSLEFPPIPGGVSIFLHNLCIQLSRMGHKVDVLTPFREGSVQVHAGQQYRVYQYKELRFFSSIIPLYQILSLNIKNKYDLIFIGHLITTHAFGVLFLRLMKRMPYILLVHGKDIYYSISKWVDTLMARLLLNNTSMILCNSRVTANHVADLGYRGNINILHPGADPKMFNPKVDTAALIKRYNLAGHRVLLSASKLVKRKGHEQVLRALPTVVRQIPDVIYLIAGQGEEETRLRRLVAELSLEKYVVFADYVEQEVLPALYCACDIFIMPSFERDDGKDYEGFGIAFSEANACGKPVIGGRSGGVAEAVTGEKTGLLVDPHNTEEIASAIIRLLIDVEYAKKLGENGRKRVEKELSWGKVGERLDMFLNGVVKKYS